MPTSHTIVSRLIDDWGVDRMENKGKLRRIGRQARMGGQEVFSVGVILD